MESNMIRKNLKEELSAKELDLVEVSKKGTKYLSDAAPGEEREGVSHQRDESRNRIS